jgi:hypothetical protein
MRFSLAAATLGTLSVMAVPAIAQQTPEAQCSTAATQATGYTPGTSSGPDGSRVAGAARGAAAGAVVGGVQNNQYDNAPDALGDANREDKAKSGPASSGSASAAKPGEGKTNLSGPKDAKGVDLAKLLGTKADGWVLPPFAKLKEDMTPAQVGKLPVEAGAFESAQALTPPV